MAIAPISLQIDPTPGNRIDLRYPNGVEPAIPDIVIATIPSSDFVLTAGTPFSKNFSTYASGADLTGAIYTIQAVSGSLAALDLGLTNSTLSSSTPDAGTGVFYLQIEKSGYFFPSNTFSIVCNPAPVTDTQAPTEVFGLRVVNISTTRNDLTIDWPADIRTATVDPSDPVRIVIERQTDGGAFSQLGSPLTASGPQPSPALSFTAIGVSDASGSQNGADITLSCSDGVYYSAQDAVAFYGGLISGDFEVSVKNPDISSGYSWSGGGLMVRQNRTSMCPSVSIEERTNTNSAGAPCQFRSVQGGTITYTPDGQIAPGVPQKLIRTGHLFIYQVWDTSALTWLTMGSGTVVMTDPVEVGVRLARGTPGAPITAIFPQFRVSTLSAATYSDTTVTAGHSYGYRARARDSASPANDSVAGPVSTVSTQTPANVIRYTPGWYMVPNMVFRDEIAASQMSTALAMIQELANETHVKGVKFFFQWRFLEGQTQGDYTAGLARMRQLRDACAAIGKKLWMSFLHVIFGGYASDHSLYFPAYIVNGSQYGLTVMSNGLTSRSWQAATMGRIIAQCQGYANADNGHGIAFKDDPAIEAIQIDETSIAVPAGTDGMSNANVLTQYQRWMTELRAACPTLGLRLCANFLGSSDQMWDVINTAVLNKVMVGGPDTILTQFIDANRIFTGTTPAETGVTDQTRPIVDRRGVVPFVAEVQTPSVGGSKGNYTTEQLVNGMLNGYSWLRNGVTYTARAVRPQYIQFVRQTNSAVGVNWNSPRVSDGAESTLSFIRRTNGAVFSTARPSGY